MSEEQTNVAPETATETKQETTETNTEVKAETKSNVFTQEQLDNIIKSRLEAEQRKYEKRLQEEEKQKAEILKQKQLEEELKSNAWVVTKNTYEKDIIEKDYETFWKEKMLELGGDYSIWSNAPENPSYN